jgi:hypothetical protein
VEDIPRDWMLELQAKEMVEEVANNLATLSESIMMQG